MEQRHCFPGSYAVPSAGSSIPRAEQGRAGAFILRWGASDAQQASSAGCRASVGPSASDSSRHRTQSSINATGRRRGRLVCRAQRSSGPKLGLQNLIRALPRLTGRTAAIAAALAASVDLLRFLASVQPGFRQNWRSLIGRGSGGGPEGLGATSSNPTVIYDVRGRVVAKISSETVPIDEVSDALWQAVVASEDRRFFSHCGVDLRGLGRAVLYLGRRGGGSTLTQQLVKNRLLSSHRTLSRKASEMVLAVALERNLSKQQILERYLNTVYWGHGAYGIGEASATYFRKQPSELRTAEAAMLAALLPCPEGFSPFEDRETAAVRMGYVLSSMASSGYLSEAEVEALTAKGLPNTLAKHPFYGSTSSGAELEGAPPGAPYRAPFFVSEVLYQLRVLMGKKYGVGSPGSGSLHVHTTLNLRMQEHAERLLAARAGSRLPTSSEAAIVAMDPSSGGIRVLVGGRDYASSPFNRAVEARRSPGSAFKPVVYAAALDDGVLGPGSLVGDTQVVYRRNGPGTSWEEVKPAKETGGGRAPWLIQEADERFEYRPLNFDRRYSGRTTVRDSFVHSLNIPSVKIAHMVGPQAIVQMGRHLGIKSPLPAELSLALGACEVTPLDLACAYNSIASGGFYHQAHLITRVTDSKRNELYKHRGVKRKVLRSSVCSDMKGMLRDCMAHGTGRAAAAGWSSGKAGGKTGTSDDCRDAWFAGFTPSLTACVWVGHDDNTPLNGTGSTFAAPLWGSFMAGCTSGPHH